MKHLAVAILAIFCVFAVEGRVLILENRIYTNGTGASDGNNYATGVTVTNGSIHTLTITRSGLPDLTATFEDLTGGTETDPVFSGNTSLICWANGTNCPASPAETDPFYNRTFNTSWVLGLNYITAAGVPAAETDAAHDTCAEISGCVVGAITGYTETDPVFLGNTSLICFSNGTNCPASSGGFSANQSVNTSSAVTFSGLNITATDAALQFNSSGLRWMLQVQDSGANLKFIDVQGSVILALNKDSDTTTAKNLIGTASYAGAIPVSAQGAASQTSHLFVAESSAGTDYVSINGTGFLNSSIGTFIDAKNCDTVDTDASGRLSCGTDATGTASVTSWVNVTRTNDTFQGTTLRNISGIGWTVAPFYNYSWDCSVFYRSNATTNGISFSFQVIGGTPVYAVQGATIQTVSTTTVNSGVSTRAGVKVTSTGVQVANTAYQAFLNGYIENGASTVTVWPQFSAETAADNSTILRGSNCEVALS